MSRECSLRERIEPVNPPESARIPLETTAIRAQRPRLSGWDVEFKSPLAHKRTCRSEAYGRHPGTLRVRWGYTAEPHRNTRERTFCASRRHEVPPRRGEPSGGVTDYEGVDMGNGTQAEQVPTGDDVVSRVTRALMHQSQLTERAVRRAYLDGYLDGLNGTPPRDDAGVSR